MLKLGSQNGMAPNSMQLSRDRMREYQRARRARLKAGAWASTPKDAPRPVSPPVRPSTPALGAAPPSTPAIGGRPGRGLLACGPGYPLPPDQFVASPFGRWQANVETMLAALAAKNDAQEPRIAALEKLALDRERGTAALNSAARQAAAALARAVGELVGVRLPGQFE
jgi:hypothetical protein